MTKSIQYWLLIMLDAAPLILLLLIFYTLFTSATTDLAEILLSDLSVLIVIFSLTPTINHLEKVKRVCMKLLFLVLLFIILWILMDRSQPLAS